MDCNSEPNELILNQVVRPHGTPEDKIVNASTDDPKEFDINAKDRINIRDDLALLELVGVSQNMNIPLKINVIKLSLLPAAYY